MEKAYSSVLGVSYPLGYLPVFCPTIDMFTVLRLHSKKAEIASQDKKPLKGFFELRLSQGKPATFSSINQILLQYTKYSPVIGYQDDILSKALVYLHWSFPKRGFSCSPQLIPGSNRMRHVFRIYKTLLSFEKMSEERLYIKGQDTEYSAIIVYALHFNGSGYETIRARLIITEDLSPKLRKMKRKEVINGIITEFYRPNMDPFYVLTDISESVYTYSEYLASIIGMIASKEYYSTNNLSFIGSYDYLIEKAEDLVFQFGDHVTLPPTISDGLKKDEHLPFALEILKPLIRIVNEKVYFLHPMLLGQIYNSDFIDLILDSDEFLQHYLNILTKLSNIFINPEDIEEIKYFKNEGIDTNTMIALSRKLPDYLRYIKILRQNLF
jgi:hypothetical protein